MSGSDDALLKAYEQCFSEKRHYDTLSWTIGAGFVVIIAAIVTGILKLPADEHCPRLLLASFAIVTLFFWRAIYNRNRFWGEVANEKARDIEKALQFDGLGHAYMKANADKGVELKNTDYLGTPYGGVGPRIEKSRSRSMHIGINGVLIFIGLTILALAILPITIPSA